MLRIRVVISAYEQVSLCASAACCWCATMRLVSCLKFSHFAGEKLFGCAREEISSKHGCFEHAQHLAIVAVQSFHYNAVALARGASTKSASNHAADLRCTSAPVSTMNGWNCGTDSSRPSRLRTRPSTGAYFASLR